MEERKVPTWWQVEIAFRTPSVAPKFSVAQIDTILEAFEDHLSNIGAADGAGDDDTAGDRDEVEMQSRDEHVKEQGEEVNMQEQEDVQMEEGRRLDEQAEDEDTPLSLRERGQIIALKRT